MKHAGAEALDELRKLLQKLRNRPGLVERKPGIFYVKGRAFLHFHEDRAGLFADLRQVDDWLRLAVNDLDDQERLLAAVDRTLDGEKPPERPLRFDLALQLTVVMATRFCAQASSFDPTTIGRSLP